MTPVITALVLPVRLSFDFILTPVPFLTFPVQLEYRTFLSYIVHNERNRLYQEDKETR